jgi:acetate kinase
MSDAVLTLNAGSSSIKFALFALPLSESPELSGQIDGIGAKPHLKVKDAQGKTLDSVDLGLTGSLESQHLGAMSFLVQWLHEHEANWRIVGVGHRVVHGGQKFAQPVVLNSPIIDFLSSLNHLAPLHQPHNLNGVKALTQALPGVTQVACFDTAFHRTQPEVAQRYGLPRKYSDLGIRRYGFHGSSYEFIASVLPTYLGERADGKIIVAHLGNGASMCAMEKRRSVASTMGFTAVEGLVMGTRTGTLDPGVMLYLMEQQGMDAKALNNLIYKESGLLGVSGVSQDMRELLASDKPEAKEAVELFCYRISREIGSLAAALGGLDALVFTGGIGEHAPLVRAMVCAGASWLGVSLDTEANARDAERISTPDSRVDVLVLPTNEELMIARHTARLLA